MHTYLINYACYADGVSLSQQDHGPALTITIKDDKLKHDVDVDFAPTIHTRLSCAPEWGWPEKHLPWLNDDVIYSITSKGLNLVAKQNFYWTISFAEMEKELCRQIKESSGCRKKVHRIMKVLFKSQWRHGSSLSSYELKVGLWTN